MLVPFWRRLYVLEHTCREYLPSVQHRALLNLRGRTRLHHQTSASAALSSISDDFLAHFEDGEKRSLFGSNKKPNHDDSEGKPDGDEEERVSDHDWELRTGESDITHEGRAMDILQESLPNFFSTGLVNTNYHLPLGGIHGLLERNGKGKGRANEALEEDIGIYSRNIRLEYTPPTALPAPFPRVLTLDGLPLYVASSAFVRHSMNALYTDLQVVARKASLVDPSGASRSRRQKSFTISLLVSGVGRLGLGTSRDAEWDVTATYMFSPASGLISKHTVNSIDPAPHDTVFAALRSSLVKLGLVGEESAGSGGVVIPGKLNGAVNSRVVDELELESVPIPIAAKDKRDATKRP